MALLEGTSPLLTPLLDGSGLRVVEALRLRVNGIDFEMRVITVRSGKGDKDQVTTLSTSMSRGLNEVQYCPVPLPGV
jgi:site-specific recombinase XerD